MGNETIGGLVERVVREELARTLKAPPPHRLAEFVTDPASKEFSMSRLCLGLLVGGVLAVVGTALGGRVSPEMVKALGNMLVAVVVSVAGIYGVNSAAGAWQSGKIQQTFNGLWGKKPRPMEGEANKPLAAED